MCLEDITLLKDLNSCLGDVLVNRKSVVRDIAVEYNGYKDWCVMKRYKTIKMKDNLVVIYMRTDLV